MRAATKATCAASASRRARQALRRSISAPYRRHEDLLARLGKHKLGKGCLYVNKLADVDLTVLEQLIADAWDAMGERYPA